MKKSLALIALFFALLVSASLATQTWRTRHVPVRKVKSGDVPVAVELFTSEGCSSCPAADEMLRELAASQPLPGVEIIALGQHVDYWNRLGWKDPFSSPAFTQRQRLYAQSLGSGSYTPQAVVNGRYELVGSREQALHEAIRKAAKMPRAAVSIVQSVNDSLKVRVSSLPAGTAAAEVLLLLTESALATNVGRGENAGRLIQHAPVVRALRSLGPVTTDGDFAATVPQNLLPSWKKAQLRAVVLVQEQASHHIVGVAALPLATASAN